MTPLKYLFQATYKDGTIYKQNLEDKSITEPETRSCFYDVNIDEVQTFFLFNDDHTYSVNLEDGHFEVDGVPFFMHEAHVKELENGRKIFMELKDFRLIFYRQHTHNFNASTQQEISHEIVYRFGWQCTVDGKNYQQIMQLI